MESSSKNNCNMLRNYKGVCPPLAGKSCCATGACPRMKNTYFRTVYNWIVVIPPLTNILRQRTLKKWVFYVLYSLKIVFFSWEYKSFLFLGLWRGKRYPFGTRYGRVSPFERQFFRDFAQTVCKAERKSDSFYPVSMQRSACLCSKRSLYK